MKKNILKIAIAVIAILIFSNPLKAQSTGDIAFVGFNASGDDDFSLVALEEIPANSILYIKDNSGFITWDTGASNIAAGTIITFTDVDSLTNEHLGVSVGSISKSGNFNWSAGGETVLIYTGTDKDTPTTYITGMANSKKVKDLTDTGLKSGVNFLQLNTYANTDGGFYSNSRSNQTTYKNYLAFLVNPENWTVDNNSGEVFLPFSAEAFTIKTTVWNGASGTDWNVVENWTNGVPTKDYQVIIPNVTHSPVVTAGANTGNITLNSGAELTIKGTTENKGLTTIATDASLVVSPNALTGAVRYDKTFTNDNQWYFIASPVATQAYNNTWVKENLIADGENGYKGICWYDNSTSNSDTNGLGALEVTNGNWKYFKDGESGIFAKGKGYSIKTSSPGMVSFTGSGLYTTSQTVQITQGTTNNFNLVGNPFTAFLNLGAFFKDNPNQTVLKSAEAYFWNGSSYDTKTPGLHASYEIAPGQGFFVEAAADGNLVFDINHVTHKSNPSLQKNFRPEVHLHISDGTNSSYTNIYYIEGTTKGYDNGYEGKLFGGISHSFAIYSHLLEDPSKTPAKYQLQTLPNSNYENMIIPLGIISNGDKEITFTAKSLNLPEGIMVFLEDKENNKNNVAQRLD